MLTGPACAFAPAHPLPRRHGLLGDLDRPGDVFARLGPNWFASVMGTGIVATAAATLPVQWPGLRGFADAVWVLSAVWLIALAGAGVVLWTRHPLALQGRGLIGAHAAITIDAVLWPLGTITGLASSLAVPYLMFTRWQAAPDAAFGGWLMPIVPPMVSAATGALLVPHLPAGQLRLTMLLACYAMFGLSLIASLTVVTQLWRRLVGYGAGTAAMVPTLWIVLGPLGLGLRRVAGRPGHRADGARGPPPTPVRPHLVVVHLPRRHLRHRHLRSCPAHRSRRLPLGRGGPLSALVATWAVVGVRTARGAWRGRLFLPPRQEGPLPS
jgi:hypothetical protein